MVKKNIGIIGSTGSIGTQTLEVIEELNATGGFDFKVVCLTCGKNVELIAKQARKFGVRELCVEDEAAAKKLSEELSDMKPHVMWGEKGLIEAAELPMDILVTAIVGMRGIPPTLAAINKGTDIALANKETLVAAGEIVIREAKEKNVKILPVDSEHSAIFQCMRAEKREQVAKLILTASGGPFRTFTKEQLQNVTVKDALNHPTWKMGGKITIDCASMMNKGLEVIEAKWLYDMDIDDIEVIVHPQSIVHSMIRCVDGSVLAQLGNPTMKLPIQFALTYPDRAGSRAERLDFEKLGSISFEKPNTDKFPALKIAIEAGKIGGTMPACMNAANEAAVARFFAGDISFAQIPEIVEKTLGKHTNIAKPTIEDILSVNKWGYDTAMKI